MFSPLVEQSAVALSMTSVSVSTCRDRTAEFRSLSQTLTRMEGVSTADAAAAGIGPSTTKSSLQHASSRSEFNKKVSRLGLGIHEASQKIARLAKWAKRSSMFNDPTVEIQELSALIKDDITTLNAAIADLQTFQNLEIVDGNYSDDMVVHAHAVCDDLNKRLMLATKQFQDVLTTRTENIMAHQTRKQIFSTGGSRQSPIQHLAKSMNQPPPWSNSSSATGTLQPTVMPSNGFQAGNQLRRRLAGDSTVTHQMEVSMLSEEVAHQENRSHGRASALQDVESTISELSGIFMHLATMVSRQGELAIRIDDNMDESLANVEGSHSALLKHLNQISSNRSLLIKIFAVLILFLLIFIFFIG
ncbi:hypothetical protein Nepgr_006048 [Nepenthes gracilis]|uniref:t-SNARE coiled-coil homology domain-containing protein n=1 Tax=Nepenthes gracilis TaxID=150966 RepID=A0AAD3S4P0_NEPGR|nr:hypothetical protein Nepgr_006048 [Nepenthes gracilis]